MPSVESHQDILFDINSFGGFLNLLIYDFGNIDKQDPVFHFGRNFIFFHIIRQQDTLLESGIGEFTAQVFSVFLLLLFLVLFFPSGMISIGLFLPISFLSCFLRLLP